MLKPVGYKEGREDAEEDRQLHDHSKIHHSEIYYEEFE